MWAVRKYLPYSEYLLWEERVQHKWNEPSLTDHYLMVVAAEVRRVLMKSEDKEKVNHNDFLLKFVTVYGEQEDDTSDAAREQYLEHLTELAKDRVRMMKQQAEK